MHIFLWWCFIIVIMLLSVLIILWSVILIHIWWLRNVVKGLWYSRSVFLVILIKSLLLFNGVRYLVFLIYEIFILSSLKWITIHCMLFPSYLHMTIFLDLRWLLSLSFLITIILLVHCLISSVWLYVWTFTT